MHWFSRCQPSSVDKGIWAACITAMGEAFENTIYHAKGPSETVNTTRVEVTITTCMIQMCVWDSGPGFNFDQRMKALPKSVPLYAEKGRGLWIIDHIADYVNYCQTDNQLNCFTIQKKWSLLEDTVDENEPKYQ
ncbi:MAG: ATP-binding protein [Cyanobacteria bacterium P01_D01_bin.56]